MRILLQQIDSGLYLKEDGWTKTPDEALQFASAEVARSYANSEALYDTFVVLLPNCETPTPAASADNIINLQTTPEWIANAP